MYMYDRQSSHWPVVRLRRRKKKCLKLYAIIGGSLPHILLFPRTAVDNVPRVSRFAHEFERHTCARSNCSRIQ